MPGRRVLSEQALERAAENPLPMHVIDAGPKLGAYSVKTVPAVVNTTMTFIVAENRPYVVIGVTTSTSFEFGTRPILPGEGREFADNLGMRELTHPAQLGPRSSTAAVVISSRGVYLAAGKNTVAADDFWPQGRETWTACAADRKVVNVIVTEIDIEFGDDIESAVTELAAARRGYVCRAKTIDLRAKDPRLSRYEFLASDGSLHQSVPLGSTVVLDADVVVDLRKAITAENFDPQKLAAVVDLVAGLRQCDFVPGHALSQLAWNRHTGQVNLSILNESRAAMTAWTHVPINKLSNHKFVRTRCSATTHSLNTQTHTPATHHEAHPQRDDLFVLMGYLTMLKTMTHWYRMQGKAFVARDRVSAFLDVIEFVNRDGIGCSAYPFALCFALLLGDERRTNAISFFKATKGVEGIYGTAWDLYYLALLDFASSGVLEDTGDRPTFLLTGDRNLKAFKSDHALTATVGIESNLWGLVGSKVELSKRIGPQQFKIVDSAMAKLRRDGQIRGIRSALPTQDSLLKHLEPLEAEVETLLAVSPDRQ